jgi:hypothetical protein
MNLEPNPSPPPPRLAPVAPTCAARLRHLGRAPRQIKLAAELRRLDSGLASLRRQLREEQEKSGAAAGLVAEHLRTPSSSSSSSPPPPQPADGGDGAAAVGSGAGVGGLRVRTSASTSASAWAQLLTRSDAANTPLSKTASVHIHRCPPLPSRPWYFGRPGGQLERWLAGWLAGGDGELLPPPLTLAGGACAAPVAVQRSSTAFRRSRWHDPHGTPENNKLLLGNGGGGGGSAGGALGNKPLRAGE